MRILAYSLKLYFSSISKQKESLLRYDYYLFLLITFIVFVCNGIYFRLGADDKILEKVFSYSYLLRYYILYTIVSAFLYPNYKPVSNIFQRHHPIGRWTSLLSNLSFDLLKNPFVVIVIVSVSGLSLGWGLKGWPIYLLSVNALLIGLLSVRILQHLITSGSLRSIHFRCFIPSLLYLIGSIFFPSILQDYPFITEGVFFTIIFIAASLSEFKKKDYTEKSNRLSIIVPGNHIKLLLFKKEVQRYWKSAIVSILFMSLVVILERYGYIKEGRVNNFRYIFMFPVLPFALQTYLLSNIWVVYGNIFRNLHFSGASKLQYSLFSLKITLSFSLIQYPLMMIYSYITGFSLIEMSIIYFNIMLTAIITGGYLSKYYSSSYVGQREKEIHNWSASATSIILTASVMLSFFLFIVFGIVYYSFIIPTISMAYVLLMSKQKGEDYYYGIYDKIRVSKD